MKKVSESWEADMYIDKSQHSVIICASVRFLTVLILFFFVSFWGSTCAYASTGRYVIDGNSYEMEDESDFDTESATSKHVFCYGAGSIGKLSVNGTIDKKATYSGTTAFGASGEIAFTYSYDGAYQKGANEKWNLESSDSKTVNGISIPQKIKKGAVIIRRSQDRANWETVYTANNIFEDAKDIADFYIVSDDEIRTGYFYQIMVAYKMKRQTGTGHWGFIPYREYEHKEFLEIYDVYICYGQNPVTILNIENGANIAENSSVSKGFIINKGGTDYIVRIKKNKAQPRIVSNLEAVYEPGTYQISITTDLDENYIYRITVTDGLTMSSLSPQVYDGGKQGSYEETGLVTGNTSYGMRSLTEVKIGQRAGVRFTKGTVKGTQAFGISGDQVGIYMRLQDFSEAEKNGWSVVADPWGKKEKQTVDGIWTGTVNTGVLVIQKSANGVNWENASDGAYTSGLYTTDYYNYYNDRGEVLIYTPDGKDLLNGVYLKVIYAYEVSQSETKTTSRFLEVYQFYLCSNELGAITFHNLSLDSTLEKKLGEDGEVDAAIYKKAETLLSGSGTATGFQIDTSLNPTVTYKVAKDGALIATPSNKKFTTTGKYEIELTSAVGDKEIVTIYVDSQSPEASLKTYFGDGFISGKRIYSEGNYPVYEGGKTSLHIEPINSSHLPIKGVIKNTTTGEYTEIISNSLAIDRIISEPGHYVATFSTKPTSESENLPGDYRTFTFEFDLIAEGTAPGPVINKESLAQFAQTSPADSCPHYYGLTYSSAAAGNITLAFATKEAAVDYAYNYEKGTVEVQTDGTYRYTGSFMVSQKEHYDSTWDLTDAMYYFAEQAVQELYFDMSDQFTYRTLRDVTIENTRNLRTLELKDSVTIFAEGQQEALCSGEGLPFICRKPCAYLTPGINGSISIENADFRFIRDKYGCDSDSVSITDCNGKEYSIAYNRGVGAQLSAAGCPSGIVTIKESTIYGDETTYQAIFIEDGDCTAQLTLSYYQNGEEREQSFSQMDDGIEVNVDAFAVSKLTDMLDPYAIVSVSGPDRQEYYVSNQTAPIVRSTPGIYRVKVVNRIGYSYTINVKVNDSGYATIEFAGPGAEHAVPITTFYGAHDVVLPRFTRYGYTLSGYEDEEGNRYTDKIGEVIFKGNMVLKAIWEAKQYTLYMKDVEGNDIAEPVGITFGKTYSVPSPELEGRAVFLGWTNNGKSLSHPEITIDTEGDVTLIATIKDAAPIPNNDVPPSEKGHNNSILILLLLFAGMAALLVGVMRAWPQIAARKASETGKSPEFNPDGEDSDCSGERGDINCDKKDND